MEELEEELSLLEVDDVGRERARNLTTDLLLYLQQSQFYKLQVLWNIAHLVGHMRTASFLDEPK